VLKWRIRPSERAPIRQNKIQLQPISSIILTSVLKIKKEKYLKPEIHRTILPYISSIGL